jgi:hypothetical protein
VVIQKGVGGHMRRKLLHACSTLAIVVILCAPDSLAQDVYHGGAIDARQHGYEHGYREGFTFGQSSQVSIQSNDRAGTPYLRFERNLTASSDAPLFRSVETRLLTTGWACLFGDPDDKPHPVVN